MFRKVTTVFCLQGLLVTLSLAGLSAASAEASKQPEFKVISGYGSSTAILAGNYREAVDIARRTSNTGTRYDQAVNATSLCVAYAKMAEVDAAVEACTRAVRISKRIPFSSNIDTIARNNRRIVRAYKPKVH